jgi:hypothetical protein
MRLLLALLAVVAMFASPALAAADCRDAMQQAPSLMDMGGVTPMNMAEAKNGAIQPCCDPSSKQKPADNKGCAQMCAAMTALAVVVVPATVRRPLGFSSVRLAAPAFVSARSFEPLGLKRPPKRIA